MVTDMIARPRHMTRTYEFESMAEQWRTGPLLGIEPRLLNDDRIGRAMSFLGGVPRTMKEVLFQMVMNASQKAGIPLNKFILDTTLLQLSGAFKNAPKVVPRRGTDSFSQLIVSLVVASGSRLPVGLAVLAGNTSDSTTLPSVYDTVNRISDEGDIEFLMDRIYLPTSNILFLKEHEDKRKVYWVSPLKMGLSEKCVRELIDAAYRDGTWKPISYRSTKEIQAQLEAPLTAFETTWTLTEEIKPELAPGQKDDRTVRSRSWRLRYAVYFIAMNGMQKRNQKEETCKKSRWSKHCKTFIPSSTNENIESLIIASKSSLN